jgi:hypothetical protein
MHVASIRLATMAHRVAIADGRARSLYRDNHPAGMSVAWYSQFP